MQNVVEAVVAAREYPPCVLLLSLGIWIVIKIAERHGRSTRASTYRSATSDFQGTRIVAERTVRRDVIEIPGPPCPATVRYYHHMLSGRRRDYTEFRAQIDWRQGAMRVTTPDWSAAMERFYGLRDVEIGDAAFDPRYVIQSNPETLAPQILDEPTRHRIRALDLFGEGPLLVQLRPREFLIRVSRHMQEGRLLRQFIEHGYGIVNRLVGAATDREVRVQAVTVESDAECQVCGTKVEAEKRVLCRKCRTPHHADCWDYNDGCSTFACGERRSVL